ncbi:unnamed protein product [Ilex paraguariensis]|uniref:Uncharacterized protein n=1 Tax=Ilex paraguariensis TaxID=185542 RepID=A0ABC8U8F8_9AQUA
MELVKCSPNFKCIPKFTAQKSQFSKANQKSSSNLGFVKGYLKIFGKMNSLAVVNASDGGVETETAVVEKPPKTLRRLQVFSGYPTPSGATTKDGGVNFAICSSNATSASLCLINLSDLPEHQAGIEKQNQNQRRSKIREAKAKVEKKKKKQKLRNKSSEEETKPEEEKNMQKQRSRTRTRSRRGEERDRKQHKKRIRICTRREEERRGEKRTYFCCRRRR